ncbi:tannase/feruloyl esterase family alpha/beta hydrolase [Solimonas terrae]|uniref:Tannase/feruloyl esterase family alpha/beta hydrolase n=1 Tax=Solimonas terrae TaxID=1396819 RepID=A0A6M2BPV8_9GAMM|nr:tannase/feruloyl esterase family alpha/beta hydrolase [Solimonas terrae]NGY04107.1 tannase/feruloyl esterase family alpha/beta hydrolase [Solimonas terrae]
MRRLLCLPLLAAMPWFAACSSAETASCGKLASVPIDHGEIVAAERVRGGFHFNWRTALIGIPGFRLPASCRVELRLHPSPESDIHVRVWLPEAQRWNGRFQGIGNGGFAGSIDTMSMTVALGAGYAVAATDTGHEGKDTDGSWALHRPDLIEDFGYRAIHETADVGQRLVAAYYGRDAQHRYFSSGSNGGREALMEAQRFPDDYDGILAGCPAADGTALLATHAWIQQTQLKDPAAWIPPAKLHAIAAAMLAACDTLDGVKDGLIEDPRRCDFKPESMQCKGKDGDDCLTAAQVHSLEAIQSGPGQVGDRLLPGFEPGGENSDLYKQWITGSRPRTSTGYIYSLEFNRYLIRQDPGWRLEQFDVARDLAFADHGIMGQVYNATSPDLARFAAHGGKLILYHGWNDPALPPQKTIQYYQSVQARLGTDAVQGFVRLYMVPGMEHCFGGPGPNSLGQVPGGGDDRPGSDVNAALHRWVEQGVAPGAIIAAKYPGDLKPLLAPSRSKPEMTRPLCPYPQFAKWSGHGSPDDAGNFHCELPQN